MNKLLLMLALFPLAAHAGGLEVIVSGPTKFTDGTTIDKPLTYHLWGAPEGQEPKEVTRSVTTTITVATLPGGRWCGQVYAVVDNIYSDGAPVPPFCVTIGATTPAPDTKKPNPVYNVRPRVIP